MFGRKESLPEKAYLGRIAECQQTIMAEPYRPDEVRVALYRVRNLTLEEGRDSAAIWLTVCALANHAALKAREAGYSAVFADFTKLSSDALKESRRLSTKPASLRPMTAPKV